MDISEIITSRATGLGEKVYSSPNIPPNKLANTVSGITGNTCSKDAIIAVLDTTVFGACDDGLAFSTDAMYYKEFMKRPICVRYEDVASVSVKGIVLKELEIIGHNGTVIHKIEAENFKAHVAADILNIIVTSRKEDLSRISKGSVNNPLYEFGQQDFDKFRAKIKNTSTVLILLGCFLLCFMLWWWGIAAIIIGIELRVKHRKDASLLAEGMPIDVYCEDAKEVVQQAWIGSVIVIGVFSVPMFCANCRKRLTAIQKVLNNLTVINEEHVITLYLRNFDGKDEKLARSFVHGYIDWLEEQGRIVRIDVGEKAYVFDPLYFERVMEKIEIVSTSDTRVSRQKMISGVKEVFGEDEKTVEALINIPESGIESYTFADGIFYVNGVNDDCVKTCSVCGIAELVSPNANMNDGTYVCSDYCKETEIENEKLINKLRMERFKKESIDAAAFGGSLHSILSSVSYNKGNIAARSFTGHGVAAENANTRIDKLMGRSAEVVGSDNAKNGADRIVNGVKIQSKYCQTAQQSVNEAFVDKGQGAYRYVDSNGKSMQLEVPRNQYDEAVAEMRKKFHEGKLPPDIKSEADAEKLVRKGHLTYSQAKNICKFGTIESLAYDAYTGAIVGATAGGISFVITTALTYYNTRDLKKSVRASVGVGLQTGGKAFAVYVLTAQVQRTAFVKAFIHKSAIDINFGAHGKFIERIGKGLDKMSGAKSGSFTKNANVAVKGAVVTALSTFAVTSTWEVGKLCCGRMSGMQCLKNIAVSAAQ